MGRRDIFKYVALITVIGAFVMFLLYSGSSVYLTSDTTDDIIDSIPGIFVFTLSIVSLVTLGGPFLLIGMLGMGVGLSILIYTMYNTGLIIDTMLWGLTLQQNQAMVIVFSGIIGGVLYATSRRRN